MYGEYETLGQLIGYGKPTLDQYREFCSQQENEYPLVRFVHFDEFCKESDLMQYFTARDWWPKVCPMHYQLPTLQSMALYRRLDGYMPFAAALFQIGSKCGHWLQSEGRDVQYPNETPAERRKRLSAERQRRLRLRESDDRTAEADHERNLANLYTEYRALCNERKASDLRFKEAVAAKWAEYEALKKNPPA